MKLCVINTLGGGWGGISFFLKLEDIRGEKTNDYTDLCWNQSVCIAVVFAVIYLEAFCNQQKRKYIGQFFWIAWVSNIFFLFVGK